MAKKRNKELRPRRDQFARKRMNEGAGWADKLLQEIKEGDDEEETKTKRKGRSNNNGAKRSRPYFK